MSNIEQRQAYGIHRASDYNAQPSSKLINILIISVCILGGVARYTLPLWWLLT